jgi:hypothetical protein
MAAGFPTAHLLEWSLGGSWRDVTADIDWSTGVRITYGRSGEDSDVGPGSMGVKLRNVLGSYTPENPGSTYSPYVIERTAIRYTITKGSAMQRFQGFVLTIKPSMTGLGDVAVDLSCLTSDGIAARPFDSDYVEENRYRVVSIGGTFDCWSMDAGSNTATWAANLGNGLGTGRLILPLKRKTTGTGVTKFGTGTMLEGRRGLRRGKH